VRILKAAWLIKKSKGRRSKSPQTSRGFGREGPGKERFPRE